MHLLSMDRSTWYEFLADPTTGFPAPVVIGRTANGRPRHRWKKWQILVWHESLQHDDGAAEGPTRKKN